jgi:exodeoxyribonuclease-1
LLRQALFQTLHPAYLTSTNGNARSDLMRVAHAVSIYAPDSITVPTDDRGRETFRLERLAPANGCNHDEAHEARADVEATIYMARLAPRLNLASEGAVLMFFTQPRLFPDFGRPNA